MISIRERAFLACLPEQRLRVISGRLIMKKSCSNDPDEIDGQKLYRAYANKLAADQTNYHRRRKVYHNKESISKRARLAVLLLSNGLSGCVGLIALVASK